MELAGSACAALAAALTFRHVRRRRAAERHVRADATAIANRVVTTATDPDGLRSRGFEHDENGRWVREDPAKAVRWSYRVETSPLGMLHVLGARLRMATVAIAHGNLKAVVLRGPAAGSTDGAGAAGRAVIRVARLSAPGEPCLPSHRELVAGLAERHAAALSALSVLELRLIIDIEVELEVTMPEDPVAEVLHGPLDRATALLDAIREDLANQT
jgi:hypothetical protein